jgi:hypothetical protein
MHPKRQWKNTPEGCGRIPQGGPGGMVVGPAWQLLVLHFGPVSSCVLWSLLVHISSQLSFVPFLQFNPHFYSFWNIPAENNNSPKLMKIVSNNP